MSDVFWNNILKVYSEYVSADWKKTSGEETGMKWKFHVTDVITPNVKH